MDEHVLLSGINIENTEFNNFPFFSIPSKIDHLKNESLNFELYLLTIKYT